MDTKRFFDEIRAPLGGKLSAAQVAGFDVVLAATEGQPLSHRSYSLATAWWETNHTMEPVREAYWCSEAWRKKHLRYFPHYGRGYVQLTWLWNYEAADIALAKAGLIEPGDLVANPDRAMEPAIAAFIMRHGMDEGWFTGVKLRDVLPMTGTATRTEYMAGRTIINGHDKADEIEDFAQIFERGFRRAGYPQ